MRRATWNMVVSADPVPLRGPLRVLFLSDHLGHADGRIHGVTTYFLETLPAFDRTRVTPTLCILQPHHQAAARFVAAASEVRRTRALTPPGPGGVAPARLAPVPRDANAAAPDKGGEKERRGGLPPGSRHTAAPACGRGRGTGG